MFEGFKMLQSEKTILELDQQAEHSSFIDLVRKQVS